MSGWGGVGDRLKRGGGGGSVWGGGGGVRVDGMKN